MTISYRPEAESDRDQVLDVVRAAFGGRSEEPALVALIRERDQARLAAVAEEGGFVIGFVRTHIANEYGATYAFMALELSHGCLQGVRATARYVDAFFEVGA